MVFAGEAYLDFELSSSEGGHCDSGTLCLIVSGTRPKQKGGLIALGSVNHKVSVTPYLDFIS